MSILNFFNSLSNSDVVFYGLIILLSIISVILFYLIYTQNKEMSKKMMEKSVFSESDRVVNKEEIVKQPITVNEVEALDTKTELIQPVEMDIPDPLELTKSLQLNDSIEDLQSLTKELETIPRERTIKMTPYEAEQEETAIISYDELVKQNDKTQEIDFIPVDEVDTAVAQVDNNLEVPFVEEVTVTEDVPVKEEIIIDDIVDTVYSHEEGFLKSLKSLQNSMREND